MDLSIYQYIFSSTFTPTQWNTAWQANPLFKGLYPIMDGSTDITSSVLSELLDVALKILPQGIIEYHDAPTVTKAVDYTVAHLMAYFDYKDSYGEASAMIRNASSRSADGLSISYSEVAKLKGDMFPSLNDYLNTTPYGRIVCLYIEKMAGSPGAFVV